MLGWAWEKESMWMSVCVGVRGDWPVGYTTKEKHRGDLLIWAPNTKEWLWFQLGTSDTKKEETLESMTQRKYAWELVVRNQQKSNLIDLFVLCLSGCMYAVLTHSLFHVVPQFSLYEVLTVFRQSKSQAAAKANTVTLRTTYCSWKSCEGIIHCKKLSVFQFSG